jgi:hypothetical protein
MSKLRQLIRESINEYIKAIDEAGHEAGMKARMEATQEAINKRKKKTELAELDEDVKEMIDERKVKEVNSEVKALEKSLAKLQKQFDKLKSKGNKSEESEVEEKEIVDEVAIDENEGMENEGMENEGMEYEEERFDEYGNQTDDGSYNADGNLIDPDKEIMRAEYSRVDESFLHMQKLAGVITEAQYKTKRKALNEDVINLTYNTDSDDLKYVKNILKKAGVLAKVVAGTFDDEVEITVDKDLRKKAIKALKDNGFDI